MCPRTVSPSLLTRDTDSITRSHTRRPPSHAILTRLHVHTRAAVLSAHMSTASSVHTRRSRTHMLMRACDGTRGCVRRHHRRDGTRRTAQVVGQLLRAIDDTNASEHTIVMLTSDHGQIGGREPLTVSHAASALPCFGPIHSVTSFTVDPVAGTHSQHVRPTVHVPISMSSRRSSHAHTVSVLSICSHARTQLHLPIRSHAHRLHLPIRSHARTLSCMHSATIVCRIPLTQRAPVQWAVAWRQAGR
jgi:hypothetical protein